MHFLIDRGTIDKCEIQFATGIVCRGWGDRVLRSDVACFVASKLTKKITKNKKQKTKLKKKQ